MDPINSMLSSSLDSIKSSLQGFPINDTPVTKSTVLASNQTSQASTTAKQSQNPIQQAIQELMAAVFSVVKSLINSIITSLKDAISGIGGDKAAPAQDGVTDASGASTSASSTGTSNEATANSASTQTPTTGDGLAPAQPEPTKKKHHGFFHKVGSFFKKAFDGAKDLFSGASSMFSLIGKSTKILGFFGL